MARTFFCPQPTVFTFWARPWATMRATGSMGAGKHSSKVSAMHSDTIQRTTRKVAGSRRREVPSEHQKIHPEQKIHLRRKSKGGRSAEAERSLEKRTKFMLLFRALEGEFLPRTARERFLTVEIAFGCYMNHLADDRPLPACPGVIDLNHSAGSLPVEPTGRRRWHAVLGGKVRIGPIGVRMTPVVLELIETLREETTRNEEDVNGRKLASIGDRATTKMIAEMLSRADRDYWERCDLVGDETRRPA